MSGAARASLAFLLLLGCDPAPQVLGPSGFLGDDAELRAGRGGQARLGYLDPSVDFSSYTTASVEPVVVWGAQEARFAGVSQAQRETLARELEAELQRAFGEEFHLDAAGPHGVIRVRAALTAAIGDPDRSDSGALRYVQVELELLDGVTNRRIAAAVDSEGSIDAAARTGAARVEARAVFRDWAERASIRVAALRSLDRSREEAPE